MTTPKNKWPRNDSIEDFDEDALPDWLDVAETLHLLLLQLGTDEDLESHRKDALSRCQFCQSGVSDDALKAFLFDDDDSLLKEFVAQRG